jgi:hypothetical protein
MEDDMSTQYGIIYGAEGSPDYDLDAPYSTHENALDGFDADRCREMSGAALIEVHECTVDHVDADWEPGAEVAELGPEQCDRCDAWQEPGKIDMYSVRPSPYQPRESSQPAMLCGPCIESMDVDFQSVSRIGEGGQ